MVNLYLVKRRPVSPIGYDETAAVVVRATGPVHARRMAARARGEEGFKPWRDTGLSRVLLLARDVKGRPGVVLQDFRAG